MSTMSNLDELRHEYNAAIANGLGMKARRIGRVLDRLEAQEHPSRRLIPDDMTPDKAYELGHRDRYQRDREPDILCVNCGQPWAEESRATLTGEGAPR